MQAAHMASGGRYPVLRTIGILAMVGALMACIGGVIAACWALFMAPDTIGTRVVYALLALSGTFFTVVAILAAAEGLKLLMDIERNTRAIAHAATESTSPSSSATAATFEMPSDGQAKAGGRLQWLEGEETAEGALIRGH